LRVGLGAHSRATQNIARFLFHADTQRRRAKPYLARLLFRAVANINSGRHAHILLAENGYYRLYAASSALVSRVPLTPVRRTRRNTGGSFALTTAYLGGNMVHTGFRYTPTCHLPRTCCTAAGGQRGSARFSLPRELLPVPAGIMPLAGRNTRVTFSITGDINDSPRDADVFMRAISLRTLSTGHSHMVRLGVAHLYHA